MTTSPETPMPKPLAPRPVDGREVHPAASAWYDPADPGVVAYRTSGGAWRTPYSGPHDTMGAAIMVARDESARQWQAADTIRQQAERIRTVEGNFARAEAAVRELELAARNKDKINGELHQDLDSARLMVRLFQWLTVAAAVVGYALAAAWGAP